MRNPPQAGQNISEWAKQQACRKQALDVEVPVLPGLDAFLVDPEGARQDKRERRSIGKLDAGFAEVEKVLRLGAPFWGEVERFATLRRLAGPDDVRALRPAKGMPGMVPAEWQAAQLLRLLERCQEAGFEDG